MKKISMLMVSVCLMVSFSAFAGQAKSARRTPRKTIVATKSVNINNANVKQLTILKGIGPKKAQAIIAWREKNGQFKTINDLTKVKGMGPLFVKRLSKNNPRKIKFK